ETVAGEPRRHRTTARLPQPPNRDACGQQCRLGEFGLVEAVIRTGLAQRPEVGASALAGFGEGFTDDRVVLRQPGQHAERLGTLTRENEGQLRISLLVGVL